MRELLELLPDVKRKAVNSAIASLLRVREIERVAHGSYRPTTLPSVDAHRIEGGQPLHRLMAGR